MRKQNIAFVFLSANSDEKILNAAKATKPYGFLVKPFRERDVLVTLDVAWYLHQHGLEASSQQTGNDVLPQLEKSDFPAIIGSSAIFLEVLNNVKIVSASEVSV